MSAYTRFVVQSLKFIVKCEYYISNDVLWFVAHKSKRERGLLKFFLNLIVKKKICLIICLNRPLMKCHLSDCLKLYVVGNFIEKERKCLTFLSPRIRKYVNVKI